MACQTSTLRLPCKQHQDYSAEDLPCQYDHKEPRRGEREPQEMTAVPGGGALDFYCRLRQWLRALRSPEQLREATLGFLARIGRFRKRIVTIWRSSRTDLGRERLRLGLYNRIPRTTRNLASLYRRTLIRQARFVAVVGSFGKTTTTRAILAALGIKDARYIGWNAKNGPSAAILGIRPHARHAALEIGISDKGQMEAYAQLLRPDIAVVTCIGSEHLSSLGTLETTRAEKAKMVSAIPTSGLVVLNGDDANVLWMRGLTSARVITFGFGESNQVRATHVIENELKGVRFTLQLGNTAHEIRTQLIGRHMIYPILAAVAIAHSEGCDLERAIVALEHLEPTHNRLQPIRLERSGAWLLLDAFKGALETIEVALDALSRLSARRKIVVLGDVEEPPGSQGPIYKALGKRVAEVADCVVYVGGKTNFNRLKAGLSLGQFPRDTLTHTRTDPHAIAQALDKIGLRQGDLVLIKGRSTQHLERVALILAGDTAACAARACARRHDCTTCPLLQRPI
jgi:UDP-N-acetylmuramoyl-tripeptide--D-alanyl-D-alanine ligase